LSDFALILVEIFWDFETPEEKTVEKRRGQKTEDVRRFERDPPGTSISLGCDLGLSLDPFETTEEENRSDRNCGGRKKKKSEDIG
jgi:hypothetical protein